MAEEEDKGKGRTPVDEDEWLGLNRERRGTEYMKKRLIIALVVVVIAAGSVFGITKFRKKGKAQNPDVIATGQVTRGDIRLVVEGWGTLSAG